MVQHYVPRVYLKNFAAKRGKDFYVDVYEKTTSRTFECNIKGICAEKNYYTIDEISKDLLDKFIIEKVYSNGIEPMYDRSFKLLTNDKIFNLTDLQRVEILISMFQLFLRNPRMLNYIISIHTTEVENLYQSQINEGHKGLTYMDEDFSFREFTVKDIIDFIAQKATQLYKKQHLGGISQFSQFHEFAKLEVSKVKGISEFFTSDHPFTAEDLIYSNRDPLTKSMEFNIPLSPWYSLRIFHDNAVPLNTIVRPIIPSGNIGIINSLIYDQATKFVIGSARAFEKFFEISKFLDNTDMEPTIDMIRQILVNFVPNEDTAKSMKVMQSYLNKYNTQGTLTLQERYDMHTEIRNLAIEWKKSRIT